MSTVKISELTEIPGGLNANTSNSIFLGVDIPTGVTGKFTATQLAERLYANNVLRVGENDITLENTAAQFSGTQDGFLQTNMQNFSATGSSDYVATADTGTDTTHYVDVGIQGSALTQGSLLPLDAYLISMGDTATTPGGNLTVGTGTPNRNVSIVLGGYESSNVFAQFLYNTGFKLNQKPLIFADGSTQNTAVAQTFVQAVNAYAYGANTWLQANDATTLASAKSYADSHFLANTTGTFAGDLTITGNTVIKTSARINNSAMTGNNQYLIITGTATGAIGIPSNAGYTIHTAIDGGNRVVAEAYSNTASDYASFIGRRARGTAANPLPIQSGDTIVRFGGNGFGATKFSQFSDGRIEVVATENHTDIARGTKIRFMNTADGSNVATEIATFNANTVTFSGVVNPSKGVMYTPNVVTANATTYTIDFNRDSMLKLSVNDNSTISLQNYQSGKIVEVWITNSAGQNKTITHGCGANNSTSKLTTFTIQANACAFLKYFSINGDNANTFVSITA